MSDGDERPAGGRGGGAETPTGTRRARWAGTVGVALRRTWSKGRRLHPRRTAATVAGVALAVALMLVVTGIALGLASQTTVAGDSVDYWIAPEQGSASSLVVSTGGPQFGAVHETGRRLAERSDVEYASPVLVEVLKLGAVDSSAGSGGAVGNESAESDDDGSSAEFVLAVGVVAHPDLTVTGVSAAGLTPGDPHYGSGSYDGPWTGEAVLSPAAASLLGADEGTRLRPTLRGSANDTFTVATVSRTEAGSGVGDLPVAMVHLSELQSITGATSGDQADQVLVASTERGMESELAGVYPKSTVMTRSGLTAKSVTSGLPLAISLTALCVAVIVGTLFVGTTMGLEVTTDRKEYAVLGAIGISRSGQATVVAVQTLALTVAGGVVGVALGYLAIGGANALAREFLAPRAVAVTHPVLPVYGLAVAVGIAVLAIPYLLWQTGRTDVLDHLRS